MPVTSLAARRIGRRTPWSGAPADLAVQRHDGDSGSWRPVLGGVAGSDPGRRAGRQLLLDVPLVYDGALIAECAAIVSETSPRQAPATVDPDAFPHLAALRAALASANFADGYERSIEVLIASVTNAGC